MTQFRKFTSIIVLITYVRMLLATAFAMEAELEKQLPPTLLKLKVHKQVDEDGYIQHIDLALIEQNCQSREKKIVRQEHITSRHNQPQDFQWLTKKDQLVGLQWHNLPGFGSIHVGIDGSIFLTNINQLSTNTIFKIKGDNLITLHNCSFNHLKTKGLGTILLGSNKALNLHVVGKNNGLHIHPEQSTPKATVMLKNLKMTAGSQVLNHSHITVLEGGVWNLGGGDYLNLGTVDVRGEGHDFQNVRLFANAGQITGGGLTVDAQTYINEKQGKITLDNHSVNAYEMINQGQIHTLHKGGYILGNRIVNAGKLTSDRTYIFSGGSTGVVELHNYGFMKADIGHFNHLHVKNYQDMVHEMSRYMDAQILNWGTFQMGEVNSESTIMFLDNRNRMGGDGQFTINMGFNTGTFNFGSGTMTVTGDGVFDNQGIVVISQLLGKGRFENKKTLKTSSGIKEARIGIRSFYSNYSTSSIEGAGLQVEGTVQKFLTSPKTQIKLNKLVINPSLLKDQTVQLNGIIHVDYLEIGRKGIHLWGEFHLNRLMLDRINCVIPPSAHVTSTNTTLSDGILTNRGEADLGLLTLKNKAIVVNEEEGTLTAQPVEVSGTLEDVQIDNRGTFITTFLPEAIFDLFGTQKAKILTQHLLLMDRLQNSGMFIIKGDYSPRALKSDDKFYRTPITPGNGMLEITGVCRLPFETFETVYPYYAQNTSMGCLSLLGGNKDITFPDGMDLRFAKKLNIYHADSVLIDHLIANGVRVEYVKNLWIKDILDLTQGHFKTYELGGLRVGVDNGRLGFISAADGKIKARTTGLLDFRHGKAEATQPIRLVSHEKDVLMGAKRKITAPTIKVGNKLNESTYEKSHLNGAYVKTPDNLKIKAPQGNVLIDYGQVLAGNGLEVVVKDQILSRSGKITVIGDTIFSGERFHQTRPGLMQFGATSSSPSYTDIYYYLEDADPATLDVIGNLYCRTKNVLNEYSDILVSKGLYYRGTPIELDDETSLPAGFESKSRKTHYKETELDRKGRPSNYYTHWDRTPVTPSTLKIGEKILINQGNFKLSGTMSAPVIEISGDTIKVGNDHPSIHQKVTPQQKSIAINVNDYVAKAIANGMQPMTFGQRTPTPFDTTLVRGEIPEGEILEDDALKNVNLDFYTYMIYCQVSGRAYLDAKGNLYSGFDLVKHLKESSEELRKAQEAAQKDFKDFSEEYSHVFYTFRRVQDNQHVAEVNISVAPQDVNPHQNPGDIDGKKIKMEAKKSQTHRGNTVHASDELDLSAKKEFTGKSASFLGDESCTIKAETIDISREIHRHYTAYGYVDHLGAPAEVGSKKGHLTLTSLADMSLAGIHGFGLTGIDLNVGRHFKSDVVTTHQDETYGPKDHRVHEEHSVNYGNVFETGKFVDPTLPPDKQVQADVNVNVGGNADICNQTIKADGDAILDAKGNIINRVATDFHRITVTDKEDLAFGGTKTTVDTQAKGVVKPSHIEATGNIKEKAGGHLVLQAVDYIADKKILLESENGMIHFLVAMGFDYHAVKKDSKGTFWYNKSDYGKYDEHAKLCTFKSGEEDGIQFKTAQGITVELVTEKYSNTTLDGKKPETEEWSHKKDLSNIPGYEWLKLLDNRNDVIRVYVDEHHDEAHITSQGLTAVSKILIVLIMTLITGGAGLAGLAGGAGATAAGGTAAAAGGATAGAATAGATAATASFTATLQAAGAAAFKAGMTALHNTVLFSAVDNRFNFKAVGQDMTSSQTWKNIGISVASAGLTKGLSVQLDIPTEGMHGFTEQLQGHAVRAVASSAVRMAFGEKPEEVLKSAAINYAVDVVSDTVLNEVGDWRALNINQNDFSDYVIHKLAHGVVGAFSRGTVAAVMGENVGDAALGGGLGAMAAAAAVEGTRKFFEERYAERFVTEGEGKSAAEIIDLENTIKLEEIARLRAVGEMAATITATAFGGNVDDACKAARDSIDNNCVQSFGMRAIATAVARGAISASPYLLRALNLYKAAAEVEGLLKVLDDLNDTQNSKCAAADPDDLQKGIFEGYLAELNAQSKPFVTPMPEERGASLPGFMPADTDWKQAQEGFQGYDGPSGSVLTNEKGKLVDHYEVGKYSKLTNRSKGDGVDIHHAPQAHPASQVIPGYKHSDAPAIAVPQHLHRQIPVVRGEYEGTPRDLLATTIRDLRNFTDATNNDIKKLMDTAKNQYPEAFKKSAKD